jgi:hypothetical protein
MNLKILARTGTLVFCFILPALVSFGQKLSIGVVGGGSLTSAFKNELFPDRPIPGYTSPFAGFRYFSPSKDYLAGGTIEIHFSPSWSVEADGIFRQLHMTSAAVLLGDGSLNSVSPSPVVTWEFPVLAKYRFRGWRATPFIEAGPSFRTAGNLNGTDPSHLGVTAGGGVEMSLKHLKIAPAVRYTRWTSDKYLDYSVQAHTAPNQVELVVGFSSEAESSWRPLGNRMSFGVVLGTNLTRDFRRTAQDSGGNLLGSPDSVVTHVDFPGPRKMIVGPAIYLRLPRNLSLEVNALYRLISSASEQINAGETRNRQTYSFVTWEFPVLAKYTFRIRGLEPFIGLGPSFRRPQALAGASPYGVVTGGGVRFQRGHLGIEPSIRYTHWAPDQQPTFGGAVRNQTEILVGFSF